MDVWKERNLRILGLPIFIARHLTTHSTGARIECLSSFFPAMKLDAYRRARLIRALGVLLNAMENYEEIDRKEEAYVKSANDALSRLRDKSGRWWSYSVSHRTFELVVGEPLGKDNLVLSLAACEYISGPVIWSEQQLEVIWHCDRTRKHNVWEFVLQDKSVEFRAVGGVFVWRKDFDLLKHHSLYGLWYGGENSSESKI